MLCHFIIYHKITMWFIISLLLYHHYIYYIIIILLKTYTITMLLQLLQLLRYFWYVKIDYTTCSGLSFCRQSFINIRKLIVSTVYIRRILLAASHARTARTRTNTEAAKSPWIPMPDKLLNQTAKPIVRKSSEWACFFVIVYQSGTCRVCAQRGVDSEMENVREKKREKEREKGERETQRTKRRGVEVHGE